MSQRIGAPRLPRGGRLIQPERGRQRAECCCQNVALAAEAAPAGSASSGISPMKEGRRIGGAKFFPRRRSFGWRFLPETLASDKRQSFYSVPLLKGCEKSG